MRSGTAITSSRVRVYTVPTDAPEAEGTTMVLVQLMADGKTGLGYTYADISAGKLVEAHSKKVVEGQDVFANRAIRQGMMREVRNWLDRHGHLGNRLRAVGPRRAANGASAGESSGERT